MIGVGKTTLTPPYNKCSKKWLGSVTSMDWKLSQIPNSKEIWHDQALGVSNFSNLRRLVVDDCTFMPSAIPTNLLPFLNNLKLLEVRNCDSVKEVIHLEELNPNEYLGKLFPELRGLYLIDLPKLKKFCNFNESIIELPNHLCSLSIENCPDIVTFIADSTPVQPFFNEKVAFPILKELKLSKLPKLLHLCEENSHPNNVFQELTTLRISGCCKLEKLVPSWMSFQSLVKMEVSKCDGLTKLMTLSPAKSLVRLRTMKVIDCKMIEEIIHVEDGVKEDCIVFSELEFLELSSLPSLTSFCSRDYALEFPNLKQVISERMSKDGNIFSGSLNHTEAAKITPD
ncbi:Disease resistance protein [Melia azedarach]|uniref:Disease resistance protein n=1 Tax=Melia azedarach TaxID=155640 RepID=A0ACC1Y2E5_MELAZ|nr:Disease resistance protein [Melia azedarach]